MKILLFAASLRKDSLNKKLARIAAESLRKQGHEVDLADFREFEMPLYDGDVEEASGLPKGALELSRRIQAADGVVLVSPEYNNSVPGTIKNAIDWVSRERPVSIRGKTFFLMSASPGMVGGNRGLWALRVPLELLGGFVVPEMFSLAAADDAFTDDAASLKDPKLLSRLEQMLARFTKTAASLRG